MLVLAAAHLALREDPVGGNPLEGFLIDFFRVGLEHQAFTRTPTPRIHFGMEAVRKFLLVVVRIELRSQVNIALGFAQGAEKLPQIFRIGITVDHGADHESRVDDFAEAELLGEIVRPAEQVHGRCFALEQFFHSGEQHAIRIDKNSSAPA